LLNCFGFAALNLFLLLPPLLALPASPDEVLWTEYKLRFVASGATFCVALGLALAAQFALRKTGEAKAAARVAAGGRASAILGGYSVQTQ
jgi:hypothetical protein